MKRKYKITIGVLIVLLLPLGLLALTIGYTQDCEDYNDKFQVGNAEQRVSRALLHRCYGGPELLEYVKQPVPPIADNELLIRVRAAGVNPLDYHMMRGAPYIMRLDSGIGAPIEKVLGADFAGVVEKVGQSVTRFKVGDKVFGGSRGAFSDYLVINETAGVTHMPSNISFQQAAAVGVAALTALQAIRDQANVKPGDKVLINGASGGVGSFAVQIAKSMGAEVVGVCSGRNVQKVLKLGADSVIDYQQQNYTEGSDLFDVIIDMVSSQSLSDNISVLKPDGRYVVVGAPKGNWLGPLSRPLPAMIRDNFVDQALKFFVASFNQSDFDTMRALIESEKVTPLIDRVYPFTEIHEAIAYSETGRARGKIIIDLTNVASDSDSRNSL